MQSCSASCVTVANPARHRFEALDALRGVCACLVAFFHLKSTGHITNSTFIRESWLFVDFFFVLSGFVIAASYGERLSKGYSIGRFMWLRLGRVYPLHAAILLVFVAFELAKPLLGDTGLASNEAFTSPRSVPELLASFSLVQFAAIPDKLVWNAPSWSIATEVWTYFLAALLLAWGGRFRMIWAGLAVLAALAVLVSQGYPWLHRTYSMLALVRCVFGFGLGMLAWQAYSGRLEKWRPGKLAATLAEAVAITSACLMVLFSHGGALTLAAPFLFTAAVLVFAREAGWISRLLCTKPMLVLGTLSYSIYLVHVFVEARIIDIAALLASKTGLPLAHLDRSSGSLVKLLGPPGSPFIADLMAIAVLAAIVLVSWISYRLVEQPFRRWSRRVNDKFGAV